MVFNNRKNGEWGQEEQRLKNPFSAGGEFDLRIRVNNEKFEVFFWNGGCTVTARNFCKSNA